MFKLMLPSGYTKPPRFEGPIGGTPDTNMMQLRERCYRAALPPFLRNLVFDLADSRGSVRNFHHVGDFFIVSEPLREFLEAGAGCTFQSEMVRTKQETVGQFWAMKVATSIDCVLPDQSFADEPMFASNSKKSFRATAQKIDLSPDVAPYFANSGEEGYYAYPCFGVRDVSMDFSSVPHELRLFQPLYWPRFLVIDDAFSRLLAAMCDGGNPGYYFWTFGFDDLQKEYHETLHALR